MNFDLQFFSKVMFPNFKAFKNLDRLGYKFNDEMYTLITGVNFRINVHKKVLLHHRKMRAARILVFTGVGVGGYPLVLSLGPS